VNRQFADLPDVLTFEQARALLGLGDHTLRALVRGNRIPHRRAGRRILFSKPRLQAWLDEGEPAGSTNHNAPARVAARTRA
jgi:excisionase family DNA binding protein